MREIEKNISKQAFINKLKRLVESLESDEDFVIQVKKRKIKIPAQADFRIEHEKSDDGEELEFELKW